jgi:hypothetical protein
MGFTTAMDFILGFMILSSGCAVHENRMQAQMQEVTFGAAFRFHNELLAVLPSNSICVLQGLSSTAHKLTYSFEEALTPQVPVWAIGMSDVTDTGGEQIALATLRLLPAGSGGRLLCSWHGYDVDLEWESNRKQARDLIKCIKAGICNSELGRE